MADRHWRLTIAVFTVAFFWAAIRRATIKPFWHDEIYTIAIAGLPSLRSIWAAQQAGLDVMPPFNSIVTHAVFSLAGQGAVSTRLPAMLGVWILTLAMFAIVRQRANTIAGLSAMLMTFVSGATGAAYEARGYGLMLGLFALALLSWSEAASGRRRALYLPLLALALAAGIWTHYYAALVAVPILAGELARFIRTKKPDWGVLVSLVAAGVASVPLYPLARLASAQSATYFGRASVGDIPNAYAAIGGALFRPWALLVVVLIAGAAVALGPARPRPRPPEIPAHEVVAALMTLLIPVWAILAGLAVSGAFVPRYAMPAVIGFCVLVPILVSRLRSELAPLLLCACLATAFVYSFRDVRPRVASFQNPIVYRPHLTAALSQSAPVVVTGTLYLQMWYYTPAEHRDKLAYIADPSAALRLIGTDSLERDYLVLREWYPVGIHSYDAFVAAHPRFFVYDVAALTWLLPRLREDRAELRVVGEEWGATMYDVTMPPASSMPPRTD